MTSILNCRRAVGTCTCWCGKVDLMNYNLFKISFSFQTLIIIHKDYIVKYCKIYCPVSLIDIHVVPPLHQIQSKKNVIFLMFISLIPHAFWFQWSHALTKTPSRQTINLRLARPSALKSNSLVNPHRRPRGPRQARSVNIPNFLFNLRMHSLR